LQFLKSEFRGQLPQPYSSLPHATSTIPPHMNDENREEPSRYVSVICIIMVVVHMDIVLFFYNRIKVTKSFLFKTRDNPD